MTDVERVMPIFVACPRFRRRFGKRVPTDRGGIEKPFIRWGRLPAMRTMRNGPRIQDREFAYTGNSGTPGYASSTGPRAAFSCFVALEKSMGFQLRYTRSRAGARPSDMSLLIFDPRICARSSSVSPAAAISPRKRPKPVSREARG